MPNILTIFTQVRNWVFCHKTPLFITSHQRKPFLSVWQRIVHASLTTQRSEWEGLCRRKHLCDSRNTHDISMNRNNTHPCQPAIRWWTSTNVQSFEYSIDKKLQYGSDAVLMQSNDSPKQGTFYHYNDFWRLEPSTREWTRIEVKGKTPPSRSGHRMTYYKNYIILFGGMCCDISLCCLESALFNIVFQGFKILQIRPNI